MPASGMATIDGNEAVADVAYRLNEVIAIYPITPSSPMGEWADAWASEGRANVWGAVPSVVEMQSEGGAAGAVHGALQAGSLTTTFTASQGLLLMIPNLYKIAGELTPAVLHVAARSLAAQALSIFGDHSDVMAARATGVAMLASGSVQEAMDFALIAQAATLAARIPFIHFFDGFRTSHEVAKVELLSDDDLRALMDDRLIQAHRERALSPDHPVLRGTAQNPDVFFQAREAVNPYYDACPGIVQHAMDTFAARTGRAYRAFDYHGAPDAERVLVLMGSGAETAHETMDRLLRDGERVGVLKVRLYRPFDARRFVEALPSTTRAIAVLDRTKEPGGPGEPLYLDCVSALEEAFCRSARADAWKTPAQRPTIIGGRYGLSSKEFTPAMVKAVFDHLREASPKRRFTVGIHDDVTRLSLPFDASFTAEPEGVFRAVFYGLGADGTVGANKSSIKIIGDCTDNYAQGYFVYDSRKSGAVTVSHLRFGRQPIRSAYLIEQAQFIGCHQPVFLDRYEMLKDIAPRGIFLLNTPHGPEEIWDRLPRPVQEQLIEKSVRLYVIDAHRVAQESGMGGRINTVMQTCFFAISGVLPRERALDEIRESIRHAYGMKGDEIVSMNLKAVDHTLEHLHDVKIPSTATSRIGMAPPLNGDAPAFVREVLGGMIARRGDDLPVGCLPADGTYPTGTAKWEKRNLAHEIPVWDPEVCVQCGKCVFVCPHSVIRAKVYDESALQGAPEGFLSDEAKDPQWKGLKYTLQVAPEDCTGCGICVNVCPARNKSETRLKAINMEPQEPLRERECANWEFFLSIPETDRRTLQLKGLRQQQVQEPLFEFSSACAGCGETPYLRLVSALFGDRAYVANATGCSSIYGGNLPTTPWTKNADGRGPAWSNSLFEDNAEFGLGFRLSVDHQRGMAEALLRQLAPAVGAPLADAILTATQHDEADICDQRDRVAQLKERLHALVVGKAAKASGGGPRAAGASGTAGKSAHAGQQAEDAARLLLLADMLVKKSVWIIGGDGWAYDIGFGGLDHVLASGRNVNVLVLDTEVYSNTGGQMSKSTPRAAVAKFAAAGKPSAKKDLGLMAMTYGNVYVARVAMGAKDEHTLKAFLEAEAYDGPSLIIAYSHCIAHGINMTTAMQNQAMAVKTGQWLLYRFHPDRLAEGKNPLQLDSSKPREPVEQYLYLENRFKMLTKSNPDGARRLFQQAQTDADVRWRLYEFLADPKAVGFGAPAGAPSAPGAPGAANADAVKGG